MEGILQFSTAGLFSTLSVPYYCVIKRKSLIASTNIPSYIPNLTNKKPSKRNEEIIYNLNTLTNLIIDDNTDELSRRSEFKLIFNNSDNKQHPSKLLVRSANNNERTLWIKYLMILIYNNHNNTHSKLHSCYEVPILNCIEYIANNGGLSEEGIFRIGCGPSEQYNLMLSLISNPTKPINKGTNIHIISNVLKQLLRRAPDTLLTHELLAAFISAGVAQDSIAVKFLIYALPNENFNILQSLFECFSHICNNTQYTRMTPSSLAIVVGPNLYLDDSPEVLAKAGKELPQLFQIFLDNFAEFFADRPQENDKQDSPSNLSPRSSNNNKTNNDDDNNDENENEDATENNDDTVSRLANKYFDYGDDDNNSNAQYNNDDSNTAEMDIDNKSSDSKFDEDSENISKFDSDKTISYNTSDFPADSPSNNATSTNTDTSKTDPANIVYLQPSPMHKDNNVDTINDNINAADELKSNAQPQHKRKNSVSKVGRPSVKFTERDLEYRPKASLNLQVPNNTSTPAKPIIKRLTSDEESKLDTNSTIPIISDNIDYEDIAFDESRHRSGTNTVAVTEHINKTSTHTNESKSSNNSLSVPGSKGSKSAATTPRARRHTRTKSAFARAAEAALQAAALAAAAAENNAINSDSPTTIASIAPSNISTDSAKSDATTATANVPHSKPVTALPVIPTPTITQRSDTLLSHKVNYSESHIYNHYITHSKDRQYFHTDAQVNSYSSCKLLLYSLSPLIQLILLAVICTATLLSLVFYHDQIKQTIMEQFNVLYPVGMEYFTNIAHSISEYYYSIQNIVSTHYTNVREQISNTYYNSGYNEVMNPYIEMFYNYYNGLSMPEFINNIILAFHNFCNSLSLIINDLKPLLAKITVDNTWSMLITTIHWLSNLTFDQSTIDNINSLPALYKYIAGWTILNLLVVMAVRRSIYTKLSMVFGLLSQLIISYNVVFNIAIDIKVSLITLYLVQPIIQQLISNIIIIQSSTFGLNIINIIIKNYLLLFESLYYINNYLLLIKVITNINNENSLYINIGLIILFNLIFVVFTIQGFRIRKLMKLLFIKLTNIHMNSPINQGKFVYLLATNWNINVLLPLIISGIIISLIYLGIEYNNEYNMISNIFAHTGISNNNFPLLLIYLSVELLLKVISNLIILYRNRVLSYPIIARIITIRELLFGITNKLFILFCSIALLYLIRTAKYENSSNSNNSFIDVISNAAESILTNNQEMV